MQGKEPAESRQELAEALRSKEWQVLDISECRRWSLRRKCWPLAELTIWLKQFGALTEAGVDIVKALELLGKMKKEEYRRIHRYMAQGIEEGYSLSQMMGKAECFPELCVQLVRIGENAGTLTENLQYLEKHYRRQKKYRAAWQAALTYPFMVVILALAVAWISFFWILPLFGEMLQQWNVETSGMTKWLLAISNYLREYGIWWLLAVAVSMGAAALYFRRGAGRLLLSKWCWWSTVYRYYCYERLVRTWALLLHSGADLLVSIRSAVAVTGNLFLIREVEMAIREIANGVNPSQALSRHALADPVLVHMMEVGIESGRLAELLEEAADFYSEEVRIRLQRWRNRIGPLVLAMVGAWVGFLMASILLPMLDTITAPMYW